MGVKPTELAQLRANLERGARGADATNHVAAAPKKRARKPVLVRAAVFCTRCGSYSHLESEPFKPGSGCEFPHDDRNLFAAFAVPLHTENVGNGSHGNHFAEAERRKKIRTAIGSAWRAAGIRLRPAGYRVTVTRISAGTLDAKNLEHALKSVIDSVAACMGVDDSTPIVEWAPSRQEAGDKGQPAVRIELEEI